MSSHSELFFRTLGTAMAAGLVWIALTPFDPVQLAAASHWYNHYLAHFVVFAALGSVWSLGFRRTSPLTLVIAIGAFGFAHEALEIVGHAHPLELPDALVNAAGVVAGVACVSVLTRVGIVARTKA
ncbi:MAG TPA: hypothetical protein VFZ14_14145 [Burkholderiales bacterium]|nr:hypothetical protein [Burkholderiales bacterium]